jgi:hypothetical protein
MSNAGTFKGLSIPREKGGGSLEFGGVLSSQGGGERVFIHFDVYVYNYIYILDYGLCFCVFLLFFPYHVKPLTWYCFPLFFRLVGTHCR